MQKHLAARVALLICVLPLVSRAAVTLPPIFGDHMVIQRDMKAPIWGKGAPGEKITIEFAGKKTTVKADDKGEWKTRLSAAKVGTKGEMTISSSDGGTTVIKDVLVGDVWIASGQSNMQWSVKQSANPDQEIASAKDDQIRFFRVPNKTALQPTRELEGKWEVCSPDVAGGFSAVGYFFARELRQREGLPIGIIQNAWGGMPVESFMSDAAVKSDSDFAPLLERKAAAATQAATPPATGPRNRPRGADAPQWASNIYNKMVYPLVPYAIKGAIWYQGESNAGRAAQYRKLFPAMIADWREQWGQGDFPFLFVQLANFAGGKPRPEQPAPSNWAELREAQTMTLKWAPNTGQAVIIDIGDSKDIHPKNKQDVGTRLALAAEKLAYGKKKIEYSGPMFKSMKVEGDKVRIKFTHADALIVKDLPLKGFEIAGEDQKFVWADAKPVGGEVIVSSPSVPKPVAVRYAWQDDPQTNLYNAAGLPACPFRTDGWKMATAGVK